MSNVIMSKSEKQKVARRVKRSRQPPTTAIAMAERGRVEPVKGAKQIRYNRTLDDIVKHYSELPLYRDYDKRTLRTLAKDAIKSDLKEYHARSLELRRLYFKKYHTVNGKRVPLTLPEKRKLANPIAARRDQARRNIEKQMGRGEGSFFGREETERFVGES